MFSKLVAAAAAKITGLVTKVACAVVPFVVGSTSSAPTLDLDFDPTEMFTYTNTITNSLMPIVYISAGFALGFAIIYMLKNAFSRSL